MHVFNCYIHENDISSNIINILFSFFSDRFMTWEFPMSIWKLYFLIVFEGFLWIEVIPFEIIKSLRSPPHVVKGRGGFVEVLVQVLMKKKKIPIRKLIEKIKKSLSENYPSNWVLAYQKKFFLIEI